jgi:hypothetical protein
MGAKIIHYCWFGENPKSAIIEKCVKSWSIYFPDWEIKEWNETNFDVNSNLYVKQAYEAKKYAFVSDYVRFLVLDLYGGIYFDTDVEVVKRFDDLLDDQAFAGFETDKYVAPGLVLYAKEPGNPIIQEARKWYENAVFLDENGNRIRINVCGIFTGILKKHGFVANGVLQNCDNMMIYPKDYFCPFDDATGILNRTDNTYAIHWYAKSWMSSKLIARNRITRTIHRVFGTDIKEKLLKLCKSYKM